MQNKIININIYNTLPQICVVLDRWNNYCYCYGAKASKAKHPIRAASTPVSDPTFFFFFFRHQFSCLEMKFSIAIVSFAATVAFAVAEDCTETSEAGCNALDACTWCNCSAIPSECWTIAAASKVC